MGLEQLHHVHTRDLRESSFSSPQERHGQSIPTTQVLHPFLPSAFSSRTPWSVYPNHPSSPPLPTQRNNNPKKGNAHAPYAQAGACMLGCGGPFWLQIC
jgi:hypothetical protein